MNFLHGVTVTPGGRKSGVAEDKGEDSKHKVLEKVQREEI